MKNLQLERPLVFFDLETTGVNIQNDRIVEISVLKVSPDGTKKVTTRRINPEMPIPPGATEIHGISDADVADCPTFKAIAINLFRYLEDCDLAGYNILRFDVPLLQKEFTRAGLTFSLDNRRLIDAFRIFSIKEPRDLASAYRIFCNKEMQNAHSAEADTLATFEILEGELEKYSDLPRDLDALHEFCNPTDPDAVDPDSRFRWSGDQAVVNFGRNTGVALTHLAANDPGFLKWIINADFSDEVKRIASDALRGKFPERPDKENRQD